MQPGEIVALSNNALTVQQANPAAKSAGAAAPSSTFIFPARTRIWDGRSVHQVRQRPGCGSWPTKASVDADVVIPVPDSSIPAAIGYAAAEAVPYNDGFIKNRYIGRTFIEPTDSLRQQGVALKFNVINENVLRQTSGDD